MFNLTGKTALVTGATGGIGGAIAKALHAQGATVGISGRNEGKLKELAGELGARVYIFAADLSSSEAVDALVKSAEEGMGQIDILVNNAGLTKDGLSMRMKDEDWQAVLDVNLTGVMICAREAARQMITEGHGGTIVNFASIAAYAPSLGWVEFDPTNDQCADTRYITLAWGSDFADVVPLRGVILGGGMQDMDVSVSVIPMG